MGGKKQKDGTEVKGDNEGQGESHEYAASNLEKNYGKDKIELIRRLVDLKSTEARLNIEIVEAEKSMLAEVLRLSGLIGELRLLETPSVINPIEQEFLVLFDKYVKK